MAPRLASSRPTRRLRERPCCLPGYAGCERTPADATLVTRGGLVVTTDAAARDAGAALTAAGAEVVTVPARDGRIDLAVALEALGERGLHAIYAEPGAVLSAALVEAGLVDEFVVHRGGGSADGWPAAWHNGTWRIVRQRVLGDDTELVARPA